MRMRFTCALRGAILHIRRYAADRIRSGPGGSTARQRWLRGAHQEAARRFNPWIRTFSASSSHLSAISISSVALPSANHGKSASDPDFSRIPFEKIHLIVFEVCSLCRISISSSCLDVSIVFFPRNKTVFNSRLLKDLYCKRDRDSAGPSHVSAPWETSMKAYLEDLAIEQHRAALLNGSVEVHQWRGHTVGYVFFYLFVCFFTDLSCVDERLALNFEHEV